MGANAGGRNRPRRQKMPQDARIPCKVYYHHCFLNAAFIELDNKAFVPLKRRPKPPPRPPIGSSLPHRPASFGDALKMQNHGMVLGFRPLMPSYVPRQFPSVPHARCWLMQAPPPHLAIYDGVSLGCDAVSPKCGPVVRKCHIRSRTHRTFANVGPRQSHCMGTAGRTPCHTSMSAFTLRLPHIA